MAGQIKPGVPMIKYKIKMLYTQLWVVEEKKKNC